MKKHGSLLAALEDLDELVKPEEAEEELDDDEGGNLDETMLMVMENEQSIDNDLDDIAKMEDGMDETEASIERLDNISITIRQFGISKSMMMAADPHRELVVAGLCPAYEELDDMPVKDETAETVATNLEETSDETAEKAAEISARIVNSVAAVEDAGGIAAALTVVKGAVSAASGAGISVPAIPGAIVGLSAVGYLAVAAIMLTIAALVKLTIVIKKMIQSQKIFLNSAAKRISGISEFDEEKFKKTEVSAYSKQNFQSAIKTCETLISVVAADKLIKVAEELDSLVNAEKIEGGKITAIVQKATAQLKPLASNKMVTDFFGLTIEIKDGAIPSVTTTEPKLAPEKKSLGELGWKAGDAKQAIAAALDATGKAEAITNSINDSVKASSKIIDTLKKHTKKDESLSAEAKQAIGDIRKIIEINRTIIKVTVSSVYKVNSATVRVANAAIKSAK